MYDIWHIDQLMDLSVFSIIVASTLFFGLIKLQLIQWKSNMYNMKLILLIELENKVKFDFKWKILYN